MEKKIIIECFKMLIEKGKSQGLTIDDYYMLLDFLNSLDKEDELYQNIYALVKAIQMNGKLFYYSGECISYISEHAYLLPLVLANNDKEIKLSADNSYLFYCQFSKEDKPLMSVTDYKNLVHCFGCKSAYNAITYLQKMENLSFPAALELLTKIYILEKSNASEAGLVEKYQSALLSSEYTRLLSLGYQRLVRRGIARLEKINIEEMYMERYSTIIRVRRKEEDIEFKLYQKRQKVHLDERNQII